MLNSAKVITVVFLGFICVACSGLWEENAFKYYPDDISKIVFAQVNSQQKTVVRTIVEKKTMATIIGFIDLRTEVPISKHMFKYHMELFTKDGNILYISFEKDNIRYLNKQYEFNVTAFEFLKKYFEP